MFDFFRFRTIKKNILISILLSLPGLSSFQASAQSFPITADDEVSLYASTKQVNQFFSRFNNEESIDGIKYYDKDSLYRSSKTRSRFLNIVFDNANQNITDDLKQEFIKTVTNPAQPSFLNFHGGNWIAQVTAVFIWEGKEVDATLFLKLQEEKIGSKWVISKIKFKPFDENFVKDTNDTKHFLHPLSHELEFMNLYKVFHDDKNVLQDYTERNYEPDFLTLFFYEIKKGNLKFKTVHEVKFHFFQIEGWYFELSEFNRIGNNTGWLISDLIKISPKEKKLLLKNIYHKYD